MKITPPPIREEMFSRPGILARAWIMFFQRMHGAVQDASEGNAAEAATMAAMARDPKDYDARLTEIEAQIAFINTIRDYARKLADLQVLSALLEKSGYSCVDIDSGTIDGAAINNSVIGGTAPAEATFTNEYLSSPDVDHGMTSIADTHAYAAFFKVAALFGGLDLYGLTDADQPGALRLTGVIGVDDPTDTNPAVIIRGGKRDGVTTGWKALAAAELVLSFYNYTSLIGQVYGNGEWILPSIQNTPIGSSIASTGKFTSVNINGAISWSTAESVADDGHIDLPTITANCAAHGFIQVSSSGIINESAEFEINSTGNAALIRGTANVVANADTDTKVCIGTAAAQNPMIIKNRLGGTRNIMITLCYK
jgi:hypothetical protein